MGGNGGAPLDHSADVGVPAAGARPVTPHVGLSGIVFFLSVCMVIDLCFLSILFRHARVALPTRELVFYYFSRGGLFIVLRHTVQREDRLSTFRASDIRF